MMNTFLRVDKENIINQQGKPVILQGVNLGGWLNMEGYILGSRNIAEHQFKNKFRRLNGKKELEKFSRLFRGNFIREIDFKNIKKLGFNCLRLPFNFRMVLDKKGLKYLDRAIRLCKQNKIYSILDLHAAPGSQNPDWHADSSGRALLWKDKNYQKKFIEIWQILSLRYKDEPAIAGFDVLNEPVYKDEKVILCVYKQLVKAIREIDKKHIIFLEANMWAREIEFLGRPWDDNLAYSIHFYTPLEFIFGFVRNLKYPGKIFGKYWSKQDLKQNLLRYYKIKKKYQVPIFVGEFGQNSRCPYCHKELDWLKDTLDLFKQFGFHWTYWTYKAVAGGIYPDGVYQYLENPAWVSRQEPIFGWETYYSLWKKYKQAMVRSWQTENFSLNQSLASILTLD